MRTYGKLKKLKRRGKLTKYYYCRVFDRATSADTWITTGCTGLDAAKRWRRTQEGPPIERVEPIATSFVSAYADWLRERESRVSTGFYKILKCRGDRYWIPFFSGRDLGDITRRDIATFLSHRQSGTVPGAKTLRRLAAATMNGELRALRDFFAYCVREEWIPHSPIEGIRPFSGEMRRRRRTLTPDEEGRLIQACREPVRIQTKPAARNSGGRAGGRTASSSGWQQLVVPPAYLAPLVVTALNTGFRRRTLLSLEWRHLDNDLWRIPAELLKTSTDYVAPAPRCVLEELKRYRSECAVNRRNGAPTTQRLGRSARIFGLATSSNVNRSFQSAVRRAGLDGLTFHDLRRCYLNKLRTAGVPLDVAMELTGHKSIAVVQKYYREVPHTELRDAIRALDGSRTEAPMSPPGRQDAAAVSQ